MNRDPRLIAKRQKWVGLYMRKRQAQKDYEYQTAIGDAASLFSIKKRTAIKDFTEFNKKQLVTSTHLQFQLNL